MALQVTISDAKGLIARESKRFQAALESDPAAGRIRPISYGPWYAAAIADFERQPGLIEACVQAPDTVIDALSVAANCGLVPGSAHGQFYLIPRWNSKRQSMTATFIIGYKGMIDMAYRHPRVHKCEGFLVYEGEPFEWEPGAGKLMHKWSPHVTRGEDKVVAAYSRVVLTVANGTTVDQEPLVSVMTRDEILAVRDRSDAWKAFTAGKIKSTPWSTDPGPMMRKTVIRAHYNGGSIPRSADLMLGIQAEQDQEERLSQAEFSSAATAVTTTAAAARSVAGLAALPDTSSMLPEQIIAWVDTASSDQLHSIDLSAFHGEDRKRIEIAIEERLS